MKNLTYLISLFLIIGNCSAQSTLEKEQTLKIEDRKMDALIDIIYDEFASDKSFIAKFKLSQSNWEISTLSDLEMLYPNNDKEAYGSMISTCENLFMEAAIKERIAYLQQWTKGVAEGDLCSGSKPVNSEEEAAADKAQFHLILQQEEIIFDDQFTLQDFTDLIDIENGVLSLRDAKSGDLDFYSSIKRNQFENDIKAIPKGKYQLSLSYRYDDNKASVKKWVRIE